MNEELKLEIIIGYDEDIPKDVIPYASTYSKNGLPEMEEMLEEIQLTVRSLAQYGVFVTPILDIRGRIVKEKGNVKNVIKEFEEVL